MPRELHAIIAHIRAVSADPSISTTLIQTEDLEVLCSAAEGERDGEWQLVPKEPSGGYEDRLYALWYQAKSGKEFYRTAIAAAPSPPPETRAAEEWISRDDHIAAMEALRAEYMQRLLGSEPRTAGVGEEEIARALFLHDYGPQFGDLFDRIAGRGGLGDTSEAQGMWDKTHSRARAILALHNPAATSEGGES